MTELETMQRAKTYMDKLAQGIDPISNAELPEDSALNNVRLARCFFYVSGILDKVISNGGLIGEKPKLPPFAIASEKLSALKPSPEPVAVTQLVQMINDAANAPHLKKLSYPIITNWLQENGFLEKVTMPDGKGHRMPTENGKKIGLFSQTRQGMYREYYAVLYDTQAQQFVLDHLEQMLKKDDQG